MTNPTYAVSVTQLKEEADGLGRMAASEDPTADAMDRTAIAVYTVGAALAERLEAIMGLMRERSD